MQIEISDRDSKYIWETMRLKDEEPLRANDECWFSDGQFYDLP